MPGTQENDAEPPQQGNDEDAAAGERLAVRLQVSIPSSGLVSAECDCLHALFDAGTCGFSAKLSAISISSSALPLTVPHHASR
ncbi:MAG: hypothetical protein KGJ62_07210 [Armatimonadetes bacterium]|nr:hypothetical protein [Armatimonadota bacterium]MDE2207098.1 hypothetical protein [Armatimonadota bacterium]